MNIVFDLDDTLYDEDQFILSGYFQVSKYLSKKINLSKANIFKALRDDYFLNGRDKIFDKYLLKKNFYSKALIRKCILIYRSHKPKIELSEMTKNILKTLKKKNNLFIVTDGNKIVQKNKILSLGLNKYFKKIYISRNYGIKNEKPSTYCFQKIRETTKCKWSDIIYIGDNPRKDFVNLNKKKSITIRILNGRYRNLKVKKNYDAKYKINKLNNLEDLIIKINKLNENK